MPRLASEVGSACFVRLVGLGLLHLVGRQLGGLDGDGDLAAVAPDGQLDVGAGLDRRDGLGELARTGDRLAVDGGDGIARLAGRPWRPASRR